MLLLIETPTFSDVLRGYEIGLWPKEMSYVHLKFASLYVIAPIGITFEQQ